MAEHLLHQLLGDNADGRTDAAAQLLSNGLISDDSHVAVAVIGLPAVAPRSELAAAVRDACAAQAPASYLTALRGARRSFSSASGFRWLE